MKMIIMIQLHPLIPQEYLRNSNKFRELLKKCLTGKAHSIHCSLCSIHCVVDIPEDMKKKVISDKICLVFTIQCSL